MTCRIGLGLALLAAATATAAAEPGESTTDDDTFTVRADPDGSATLHDARNLRFGVRKTDDRVDDHDASIDDRPISAKLPPAGATVATFDVTDWLMRGHGTDPYASRKLAALDASRDARAARGEAYRDARLAHAGSMMQAHLDELWAGTRDAAARKRALFELWDECAEAGAPAVVKAGGTARARLESFVWQALPPGSPGAFTPAELATFNAHRLSAAPFAPYVVPEN